MMDLIGKIAAGHRAVREQKELLERLAKMLDNDAFFWDNAIKIGEFFRREVREHFRLEEEVLFPVLRRALPEDRRETLDRIAGAHGPILEKLSEFEAIARGHLQFASKATREHLVRASRGIIEALIDHAGDEDEKLFPLLKEYLTDDDYRELEERYRRTERQD